MHNTFDVVVMGETLVEVATDLPFGHGVPAQLGICGDALNVAAAAAAAGARVGLLSVLSDDELGRAIATQIAEVGISTALLTFRRGQQGVYLVHSDPDGEREFSSARTGSVGSTLGPDDVDPEVFKAAFPCPSIRLRSQQPAHLRQSDHRLAGFWQAIGQID